MMNCEPSETSSWTIGVRFARREAEVRRAPLGVHAGRNRQRLEQSRLAAAVLADQVSHLRVQRKAVRQRRDCGELPRIAHLLLAFLCGEQLDRPHERLGRHFLTLAGRDDGRVDDLTDDWNEPRREVDRTAAPRWPRLRESFHA